VSGDQPLGTSVHDSALVTIDNGVAIPAGSQVKFTFSNGDTVTVPAAASVDPALAEGPLAAGSYSYTAQFISGNENLVKSSTSDVEPLVIDKAQLGISTAIHGPAHTDITGTHQALGTVVHDTATVTGGVNGFDLPAVSFTLNGTGVAQGGSADAIRAVDSDPLAAGDYTYKAVVGDNANYIGATSADEALTIDKAQLVINTQIHNADHGNVGGDTHVALGSVVHDTATVTGQVAGFPAPGADAVSFKLNGDPAAQGGTVDATRTVDAGPLHAGSYTYTAHVDGNANYLPADSGDEPLTVDKADTTLLTQVHNASHADITGKDILTGTIVHDSAAVEGQIGAFAPTGTVTYTLVGPTGVTVPGAETVTLGTESTPFVVPLASFGAYHYSVSYSGDSDYSGSTAADEPFGAYRGAWVSPGFWRSDNGAPAWALTG
jgi:hypothetical protein